MNTDLNEKTSAPVVRQYEIGGVRYIVRATVKAGAAENAVTKINRLIQNDLNKPDTEN